MPEFPDAIARINALSNAPSRAGGQRLGDAVPPWLVTDAALHLRHVLRRDYCTTPRALDWTSTLLTFALNWGLGLALMGAIWWMSMPARDIYMTGIAAACTLACLFIGGESALQFYRRMKEPGGATGLILHARLPNPVKALAFVISLAGLGFVTYARTQEPPGGLALFGQPEGDAAARWLAPVAMPNEAIAQRPPGWLPYPEARLDFLATWCAREGLTCTSSDPFPDGFAAAWEIRRDAAIAEQLKPHWHKSARKPNWTDANLAGAYLTGVNLSGTQMQRANLIGAQMEGANLSGARMEGTNLFWTQMEGAQLSWARLTGTPDHPNRLVNTDMSAVANYGGALRFVDLTRIAFDAATDFRNAFLDGSVTYTEAFARQMGGDLSQPCQWIPQTLSDEEFYGRWRGWLEHASSSLPTLWQLFAPDAWRDVPAIPPPDGCEWKTGPMPGAKVNK